MSLLPENRDIAPRMHGFARLAAAADAAATAVLLMVLLCSFPSAGAAARGGSSLIFEDGFETSRAVDLNTPIADIFFADPLLADCALSQAASRGWRTVGDVTGLDCSGRGIRYVYGLHVFKNLQTLDLSDNSIDGAARLSELGNLRELNLSRLPGLSDVAALLKLNALTSLRLDGSGSGELICGDLDALADGVASFRPPEQCAARIGDVAFDDAALAGCVARTAADDGLEFTRDLVQLDCPRAGVTDLHDLRRFERLQILNISGNRISDLSPLGRLQALTTVLAAGNPLTDIGPLDALPALEVLDLSGITALTDVGALLGLPALSELYLQDSGGGLIDCGDLDVLSAGLETLNRPRSCRRLVADVIFADPVLENCVLDQAEARGWIYTTDTDNVTCNDEGIFRLDGIEQFSNVVALTFLNNEISDLTPLNDMPKLRGLLLDGNRFTDFRAISGLRELRLVSARDVLELSDVGTLLFMENLRFVHLDGAGFERQIRCADLDVLQQRLEEFDRPSGCRVVPPSGVSDRPDADFSGDGRADLAIEFDRGGGSRSWRLGKSVQSRFSTADGTSRAFDVALYPADRGIAAGDADGDGKTDLLVQLTTADENVQWQALLSDGDSLGQGVGGVTVGGGNDARAIAFTDIDADGYADILFRQQIDGLVSYNLSFGSGGGYAAPARLYNFDPQLGRPEIIALEDVNGDGTADLVFDRRLGNRHCFFVRAFRNGVFERQPSSRACARLELPETWQTRAVGVADLDGDGRSELVVSYVDRGRTEWSYYTLLDGAGGSEWYYRQFFAASEAAQGAPRTVALADLNNDGRADLLNEVTSGANRTWQAHIAGDYGQFTLQTWLTGPVDFTAVGVNDYNGDGRPDLLLRSFDGGVHRVHVSAGSGTAFTGGSLTPWYQNRSDFRVLGTVEDGLTTQAHDNRMLTRFDAKDSPSFTLNEFVEFLRAKGFTLKSGTGPLAPSQCTIVRPAFAAGGENNLVDSQGLVCSAQLVEGVAIKVQALKTTCDISNSGIGGVCEAVGASSEIAVRLGPVSQSTQVSLLKAKACGSLSVDRVCASAGIAAAEAGQEYEIGDNKVGGALSVGPQVGANVSGGYQDGVISGELTGKFLLGVELKVAVNTKPIVKVGENAYVFVGGQLEAAGPAVTRTLNLGADVATVAAGKVVYVARQGVDAVVMVIDDTAEAISATAERVERGVADAADAVGQVATGAGAVVIDIGNGIADGAGAMVGVVGGIFD